MSFAEVSVYKCIAVDGKGQFLTSTADVKKFAAELGVRGHMRQIYGRVSLN